MSELFLNTEFGVNPSRNGCSEKEKVMKDFVRYLDLKNEIMTSI